MTQNVTRAEEVNDHIKILGQEILEYEIQFYTFTNGLTTLYETSNLPPNMIDHNVLKKHYRILKDKLEKRQFRTLGKDWREMFRYSLTTYISRRNNRLYMVLHIPIYKKQDELELLLLQTNVIPIHKKGETYYSEVIQDKPIQFNSIQFNMFISTMVSNFQH